MHLDIKQINAAQKPKKRLGVFKKDDYMKNLGVKNNNGGGMVWYPQQKKKRLLLTVKREYQLYLLALPAVVYLFIFHYMPIYGVQIAFKDFVAMKGISGSPWAGFKHFERFFNSYMFTRVMTNTLALSLLQLLISFPMPIILALLLNQVQAKPFKKIVQTVTYAPHFISIVVLVGMLELFLSPNTGIINLLLHTLGGEKKLFMGEPGYFRWIYVLSGVWQSTGWGSIIYLAALSAVDPGLYEAARIDGCSRFKLIVHIDFPSMLPTCVIMFIMNMGQMMSLGYQKAYLMQNTLNISTSEIIETYVYKVGLINSQFSYSAAIGLFTSLINILLLVLANKISKKLTDSSLW